MIKQPFFDHQSKFVFLFDMKYDEKINMGNVGQFVRLLGIDNYIAIPYYSSSGTDEFMAIYFNRYTNRARILNIETTFESMFDDKLKNIEHYPLKISMRNAPYKAFVEYHPIKNKVFIGGIDGELFHIIRKK